MMKIDSAERFCEKYAAAVYAAQKGADKVVRTLVSLSQNIPFFREVSYDKTLRDFHLTKP